MNEKYFVAAYLRWVKAQDNVNKLSDMATRIGAGEHMVSTWEREVKAYKDAEKIENAARVEFLRIAGEYAAWLVGSDNYGV